MHEHLQVVEQLADLLRGAVRRLVLRGHPDLGRLLDDLLPDGVHARVEGRDGPRTLGARRGLLAELGVQLVEGLHDPQAYGGMRVAPDRRCPVSFMTRVRTVVMVSDGPLRALRFSRRVMAPGGATTLRAESGSGRSTRRR